MNRHAGNVVIFPRCVCCAIATALFIIGTSRALADGGVRTVAITGQPAPGTEAGVVFKTVGVDGRDFVLNDQGQVSFWAELFGPTVNATNVRGTFTEGRGGGLALVARGNDPAPGLPAGTKFLGSELSNLQLNNAGVTAIGQHGSGFWSDNGASSLQLIGQRLSPVPGIPNATFSLFPEISFLNDLGRITLPVTIDSFPGLVVYDPANGYHVLFQTAAGQAPGLPDGVLIDPSFSTGFLRGAETNSGRFYAVARLSGSGVDATNDIAFWISNDAGALQLVIREGDAPPGISGAVRINTFDQKVNDLGQFAFRADLTGDGITNSNKGGIWIGDDSGVPQLVMRLGEHAPGTPDGAVFAPSPVFPAGGFLPTPWLFNNQRQIAFNASLAGTGVSTANDSGMWSSGQGAGLQLVAREGDPAPGTTGGIVFGELIPDVFVGTQITNALNNSGQMAFIGRLAGPGVTSANDTGIWAQDRGGVLHLIQRAGDSLDVDDGPGIDLRTIALFGTRSVTGKILHSLHINDLGQIAFLAIFTDGSQGIFVSNAVAVPEPRTSLLLASAAAVVTLRRRQ